MKITDEIRGMSPTQRRRFLKLMGFALGGTAVPAALRFAFNDMAFGVKEAQAQAAASEGTIFLEYNFRDQVDLMHMFVPPGIATYQNLVRGVNGATANSAAAVVEKIEFLGAYSRLTVRVNGISQPLLADLSVNDLAEFRVKPGDTLRVAVPAERMRVFGAPAA